MADLIYYEDSMNLACFHPGEAMCVQAIHDRLDAAARFAIL